MENFVIRIGNGRWVDPFKLKPKDIRIEDIANSLSRICRYNGFIDNLEFYSVAEHSYLASYIAPIGYELEALLHDAREAYLQDLVRPLKRASFIKSGDCYFSWSEVEHFVHYVIAEKFGIPKDVSDTVKKIDNIMLATEKEVLLDTSDERDMWRSIEDVKPSNISIHGFFPKVMIAKFLTRFIELSK